jgi:hypothetical protein
MSTTIYLATPKDWVVCYEGHEIESMTVLDHGSITSIVVFDEYMYFSRKDFDPPVHYERAEDHFGVFQVKKTRFLPFVPRGNVLRCVTTCSKCAGVMIQNPFKDSKLIRVRPHVSYDFKTDDGNRVLGAIPVRLESYEKLRSRLRNFMCIDE